VATPGCRGGREFAGISSLNPDYARSRPYAGDDRELTRTAGAQTSKVKECLGSERRFSHYTRIGLR